VHWECMHPSRHIVMPGDRKAGRTTTLATLLQYDGRTAHRK
jgi:hypothetical protein